MKKPKVIDLFAGVGGMSLGFENQGFDVVIANEYDESIAKAYFPKTSSKFKLVISPTTIFVFL